ncbi:C45 family autoproteolytic acyltransferase/hydolase [Pseudaestuariivita rosea]|uniref:C45 family autoproteolytic acyltransferase/hydolase n=1 Tax=Pseudaestuariivita rosea TaxID=2763263 RepID=UPI001ABBCC75|nr:C45 family peptidase [Pseudaestuariivita rosea]
MIAPIQIDLAKPVQDRWSFTDMQCRQSKQLVDYYTNDIGNVAEMAENIGQVIFSTIPEALLAEIDVIAQQLDQSPNIVLLVHAYYDLVKTIMGCTAFAIETDDGILHGRNLDWWSENELLATSTVMYHFTGAAAGEFYSVAWPGFAGVYSGMAPGRFAITLNSALSSEPMQIVTPIAFQIRQVFETATCFDEAVEQLQKAILPCDGLILVTGCAPGEMAVIERSPRKSAVRHAVDGQIRVTNNFMQLDVAEVSFETEILQSSPGRYARITELLQTPPKNLHECMAYLKDNDVQMDMTVQQMVFCAAGGQFLLA